MKIPKPTEQDRERFNEQEEVVIPMDVAPDLETALDARVVILVEGNSDLLALQALAARRGLDLVAKRVAIVPMGGGTNIGSFLSRLQAKEPQLKLAGLCDEGEKTDVQRALDRVGFGSNLSRSQMEGLGFFICVPDLERELIRALGAEIVEKIIADQGELGSWRTFQKQPYQRARPVEDQLHRFMGTHSGRKAKYAPVLVDALDLANVPRPLDRVLTFACTCI